MRPFGLPRAHVALERDRAGVVGLEPDRAIEQAARALQLTLDACPVGRARAVGAGRAAAGRRRAPGVAVVAQRPRERALLKKELVEFRAPVRVHPVDGGALRLVGVEMPDVDGPEREWADSAQPPAVIAKS